VATFSRIISVDVNPNVACRMNDRLSLALGLDFMKLEATLEKMLGPVTLFRLDGQGTGWGANAAILYKAEPVDLGLSYRSRIKVDVEDAHANIVGFPAGFSNSVKTEITLPDLIQAGISWRLSDRTMLNSDLEYTWWSTYDRLVMESNTFVALGLAPVQTDEKQWRNTWTFRLGGQYRVSDQWKLRAGYVYDQTPVREAHFETRNPDADRQGITAGTGFTAGNTTVDVSYMYVRFKTRHITDSLADGTSQVLNGTYDSHARLLAVNIAHKF
jgi:long-chain fatty acid transport protein